MLFLFWLVHFIRLTVTFPSQTCLVFLGGLNCATLLWAACIFNNSLMLNFTLFLTASNYCSVIHVFKLSLFTKIIIQEFTLGQDKSNMTALCFTMPSGEKWSTLCQIMALPLCIMHSWNLRKRNIHTISPNLTLLKVKHFSKFLSMKCWLFYHHWHSSKYKEKGIFDV